MRIAFGAALPVGVGGTAEYFDLFLERYIAPDKALAALQDASAADLAPSSCSYIDHRAPAASVAFPISAYEAELNCDVGRLIVPNSVTVVRKKKGEDPGGFRSSSAATSRFRARSCALSSRRSRWGLSALMFCSPPA